MFKIKTTQNKAFKMKKLMKLTYQDRSPIAEHLSKFKNLINQLGAMQMTFDDTHKS